MSVVAADTALELEKLQRDGIASVPGLSPAQVDDVWAALRDRPRYAGHVKREGKPHTDSPISCWDMHDLMVAPHFWEWALAFTPLAAAYLGATHPVLYSLNVFESTPSDWAPHPGIEVFHRDADDTRFVALFLYLTTVQLGDGEHLFLSGTHTGGTVARTIAKTGPPGTAFMADTRGYHMGVRPTTGPRRMAWARWGVSDLPASYVRDRLAPLPKARLGARYPTNPALQHIIRLVAA